jgi:hypothetical protein
MHITLDGISKRFRSVVALDDVRLEIEPGQIVAVADDRVHPPASPTVRRRASSRCAAEAR